MAETNMWFKFWARDFLTDPEVDNTPDAAMLLVIKMWCVCCLEGSCPADPEEISRKTRVPLHRVLQCHPHCHPYFEERDGRLYSKRMEREKVKSALARQNAQKRYNRATSAETPASGSANGSAIRTAQKAREPESQKAHGSGVVVDSEETYTVVGPVEAVEIVENVPRGTLKPSKPFTMPAPLSEREVVDRVRFLKNQAQTLLKKGNGKSNVQPNDNSNSQIPMALA